MKIMIVLIVLAAATVGWDEGEEGNRPPDTLDRTSISGDTLVSVADTSIVFTLETGSRLYPDWKEEQTVRLHEDFYIGDTEFMGVVKAFMPDFKMRDGEPVNWSAEMNNPAAFIHVFNDSAAVDSAWAFLNFPPHFSPNSFFTFKLKKVEGYDAPQPRQEEK